MTTVEIVDRSNMTSKMMDMLELRPRETAIVAIDMHRGHLDPEIATLPASLEDCARVIASGKDLLDHARSQGVPVIHVILILRKIPGLGSEWMTQPFWVCMTEITEEENRLTPGRKSTVNDHNIEGTPQTQIIPELYAEGDYVINNKKRLDCFMGTDLELLLRNVGAKTICLMGINTNTCILNTAFTAFNNNYRTIVLSDCVASMYGDDLHVFGLQQVSRCLGWVLTNEEFKQKLEEGRALND
ncbi:MAG: cysteine hydrolase [Defluviicoccus sp.]|nr:cysteine hydrolase [Defluviicoccus sp.]MDE0385986.1 cysteine hydrolase [Defluviicoccus sp.]